MTGTAQWVAQELELILVQLRILNYRREIGLIELHQRNRDEDEDEDAAAREWAVCSS